MARRPRRSAVARTKSKSAGRPVTAQQARAAAEAAVSAVPSAAELNLRDRMKAGPRRQAGPPLAGDTAEEAAMEALRNEVVPKSTDPKNRRSRR